jgi:hypothetical protein
VDRLDWCFDYFDKRDFEVNLISARIVKSAAFECDWAGAVEETSSPASAVGDSSWEPVLTLPRERTVRFQIVRTAAWRNPGAAPRAPLLNLNQWILLLNFTEF